MILTQARKFLDASGPWNSSLNLLKLDYSALDWKKTVKIVEDYKPLDIQSATMNMVAFTGHKVALPGLEIHN